MPLKKIIREKHVIEEQLGSVSCDCCGKVGEPSEGSGWPYGFHVWDLEGGWGDHFPGDLERFQIVVCEDCLKVWVGTFKNQDIFVLHRYSGPGPLKAKHSETEEVLLIEGYWAYPEGTEYPKGLPEPTEDEYPEPTIAEGGIWQHFKGMRYLVRDMVWLASTREPMIVYQALYGDSDIWARPASMWTDHIERGEYSGPRFVPAT